MTASWRRELRKARNGSLEHLVRLGEDCLTDLGLMRPRRRPWLAALSVLGAAAAGALLVALLTRGGLTED